MRKARISGVAAAAAAICLAGSALADRIKHPTAVFAGLDKITGRIISFDVAIDETVQFGALQVTPRICYTRPLTEAPLTDAFVEVDDVGSGAANDYKRIFGGWMFAASPGLHAVEHPVFDVWLTKCEKPAKPSVAQKQGPGAQAASSGSAPAVEAPAEPRRRVRR